ATKSETITVLPPYNVDTGLTATFVASPRSYLVPPLTIQFDASGSSADQGVIVLYSWNFGDGRTGSGRIVLHTYSSAGSYTVSLTVTDTQGATDSITLTIQVSMDGGVEGNIKPSANFTASPTSGTAPLAVDFDASGSSDPDGSITSYNWTFGDGSTGTGVTTSHTYNTAGTYTVNLTVIDGQGATGSTTRIIQVNTSGENASPIASFTASPTSGVAPLAVNFDATEASDPDGYITSYNWDFGDGNTETGVTTSHTYYNTGTYTARLTVTDNEGATSSASQVISVTSQPPGPVTFTGHGQHISPLFTLSRGLATFHMEHTGSSNFIILLRDDQGNWVELLVNEIGSFDGTKAIGIESTGSYLLDIQADGDWTVTIDQPNPKSAPAAPQTYSGVGKQVSPFFTLASGLATFHMEHTGSSNFIILLLDNQGQWVELLVNEIGSFSGGKAVGIDTPGIHLLDIQADGDWAISVDQPTPTSAPSPPQMYTGHGQEFSPFFTLNSGLTTFQLKHTGTSNFAVVLLDSQGDWVELLVNEIGSFDGSKAVSVDDSGIYLLDITADGNWDVSIEQ
ncbi:MAG: PKD domain-containing protein, partial [Dehalococcoidia bacterium]|nr:PKD domain-containing protein [Dehalococcoidia bacterium]